MPIYKFQCEPCEYQFETLVMKKDEMIACLFCVGIQLKELMTSHAVGSLSPDMQCGDSPCSTAPMCMGGGCL